MSRKCTKISFGKINRYIILILFGAIFRSLLTLLEQNSVNFENENKHPIVYSMIYSLGLCLNFILVLIIKFRKKSAKEVERKKSVVDNLLPLDKDNRINAFANMNIKQITNKEKYLWILLISIIDYISYVFFCKFWVNYDNYLNTWAFTIGFMSIFSYKILQIKYYRHHYLCIIVIIIEGISYNIISHKFYPEAFMKNYLYYLSFLVTEVIFSLLSVLDKYLIHKKYINSYEILFSQGIIEFILGLITLTITTKINKLDNFFDFIHSLSNNGKEIVIFVALIIDQFFVYAVQITVIDIFSPFHVFLMKIINEFILFFSTIDKNINNIKVLILTLVCIVTCLLMILIFIEIIELNFCGLSYMTKKNIELRAKLDSVLEVNDDEKGGIDYEGYLLSLKDDKLKELNDINEIYSIDRNSIISESDESLKSSLIINNP